MIYITNPHNIYSVSGRRKEGGEETDAVVAISLTGRRFW